MAEYVAIDVGGTKIALGIGDEQGNFRARTVLATNPAWAPDIVSDNIAAAVRDLAKSAQIDLGSMTGIGLGSPGPLDGSILLDTSNLHGWKGLDWRTGLEGRLNLPVAVQNDATAAGLGEWLYGAGRGTQHCVYVTVSTGIGAGIIVDGILDRGSRGNAGEFGHIVLRPEGPECPAGHRGCLESLASGTAIAREGQRRQQESDFLKEVPTVDTKAVFAGYEAGDAVATAIIEQAADWLGLGLSYLINLFNPEMIILGGGVATHASAAYRDRVWSKAQARSLKALSQVVQLVPAQLGQESGLMGALAVAVMASSSD